MGFAQAKKYFLIMKRNVYALRLASYKITPESNINLAKIKEMITNMYTDVRVNS